MAHGVGGANHMLDQRKSLKHSREVDPSNIIYRVEMNVKITQEDQAITYNAPPPTPTPRLFSYPDNDWSILYPYYFQVGGVYWVNQDVTN